MRARSRFHPTRHRREKLVRLERRVELLEGERARLEQLLVGALRVAVGKTTVQPLELLAVIAELEGVDLGRATVFAEREAAAA